MKKIRVLVVDDHALFRQGMVSFLNDQEGIEVVGSAGTAQEAVVLAERLRPDVVLMDLHMPGEGGISATEEILRRVPEARVLVLTVSDNDSDLLNALRSGAHGYLLKGANPEDVIEGIRLTYEGKSILSPEVTTRVVSYIREGVSPQEGLSILSPRERDILRLVAKGYTNAEIARALVISENTVKTHLRRIMEKLNVQNRAQLAAIAARAGLTNARP